mmetsp:Transcript_57969/g.188581  ORF Transcript_57969/g.188581 Transcript_57969/m.188581 type:complete len:270 (-) Transcript_57969:105-914(-)
MAAGGALIVVIVLEVPRAAALALGAALVRGHLLLARPELRQHARCVLDGFGVVLQRLPEVAQSTQGISKASVRDQIHRGMAQHLPEVHAGLLVLAHLQTQLPPCDQSRPEAREVADAPRQIPNGLVIVATPFEAERDHHVDVAVEASILANHFCKVLLRLLLVPHLQVAVASRDQRVHQPGLEVQGGGEVLDGDLVGPFLHLLPAPCDDRGQVPFRRIHDQRDAVRHGRHCRRRSSCRNRRNRRNRRRQRCRRRCGRCSLHTSMCRGAI